jgi:hypothetical protein
MALEVSIELRYSGAVPGRCMTQAHWNDLKRAAFHAVGEHWYQTMRPKHFTKEGAKEYGYAPRKGEQKGIGRKAFWRSYAGRKRRMASKQGEKDLPLVYSKETRDVLTKFRRIVATSKGVKIKFPAARKLNLRPKGGTINMAKEFTTVSQRELGELASLFDAWMARRLRAFQKSLTRKG